MTTEPGNVLVVDDEPHICSLVVASLSAEGFRCTTLHNPLQALRLLETRPFQVLLTDMSMPNMTGLELLLHARQTCPSCRVILMTGFTATQYLAEALSHGAYDFLQKPFKMADLVQAVRRAADVNAPAEYLPIKAARAMKLENEIKRASLDSIRALVGAVEAKDPYTRRHSEQVTHYAMNLAARMGLGPEEVESVRIAALLHDVGKIGIPDTILTKAGPLNEEELDLVKTHPSLGAEILRNISMFTVEARLVRCHHERWDGLGYPEGLAGEAIPLGARIINVADSVDAMLMRRTYKTPYPLEQVLGELQTCSGTQFDPEIARTALTWCREHPQKVIQVIGAA